jgi:acyl-CoA synthetase (AMP-forming)/AMP-acid ligase II
MEDTMSLLSVSQGPALHAPEGPALIRWLATDAAVRHRTLTDGVHTMSYADALDRLDQIDRQFAQRGVTLAHPIALECSQSVAGALAIMHALSRAYNVVLLPDVAARSAKEAGAPRFIPSFCSHVVRTLTEKGESEPQVVCESNPAFTPDPVVATFTGPDLYLRTSGSTGTPKLAKMTHQKWLNNALACVERWRLRPDDRLTVPVPIFHSYGFGAAFLPGLLAGSSMDLLAHGNIIRYLDRETRFNPNVAFLTPAMCDMFLSMRKEPRRYRLVVTAGDKVKAETMAGFEGRFGPLLNLYGSAEMGAVSAASPDDPYESRTATAGYALAGIALRTEASETPDGTPTGEGVGRLHCRQKNGLDGYLIQEDHWRFEPRRDDAWFDMGDLARIRPGGYVEILGRSGLSVKRDGLLVVFADVEAALEKVDGVRRAVVIAAGETARGSRLIGVCLCENVADGPRPDAVRRTCLDRLPRYAVPDDILIVDTLPLTPSGKIDRQALRAAAGEERS